MRYIKIILLFVLLFLFFIPNLLLAQLETNERKSDTAQTVIDNKNEVKNIDAPDVPITQIKENTDIRIENLEERFSDFQWYIMATITIIGIIIGLLGRKWIAKTVKKWIRAKGERWSYRLVTG